MKHYLIAVATAALLTFAVVGFVAPNSALAQNTACFMQQGGRIWACANNGRMEFRDGATLEVQEGASFNVYGGASLAPAATLTATDGMTVTPSASFHPLGSAGTVTITLGVDGVEDGHVVVLTNTTATTINLADSGTAKLSAAMALGQDDTITLIKQGTAWLELSRSTN